LINLCLHKIDKNSQFELLKHFNEKQAIPLVVNCQNAAEVRIKRLVYVDQLKELIKDGVGIFQFGLGPNAVMQIGKSQFYNDFLTDLTSKENGSEIFETEDRNVFSNG